MSQIPGFEPGPSTSNFFPRCRRNSASVSALVGPIFQRLRREDNHPFKNVYTFIHGKALFNPMLMSNVSIYLANAARRRRRLQLDK